MYPLLTLVERSSAQNAGGDDTITSSQQTYNYQSTQACYSRQVKEDKRPVRLLEYKTSSRREEQLISAVRMGKLVVLPLIS